MKPNLRVKCDMQTSLQRQWKDTWQGLDVGHRGAGSSFKAEVKQCVNFLCFLCLCHGDLRLHIFGGWTS